MAILEILQFPDKRLKTVAKTVDKIDDSIKKITEDMIETMYATNGVGLAATQVNIHQRIIVMDVEKEQGTPTIIINPEIVSKEGEMMSEEGCLSVPGLYTKVKRFKKVTMEYLDLDGNKQTLTGENNLLSACIQHELDHINGIVFYDHLSPLKKKLARAKIEKASKEMANRKQNG